MANGARYHKAPVATLGDILVVAELEHEFVAGFCILGGTEAAFGGSAAEAVVRE